MRIALVAALLATAAAVVASGELLRPEQVYRVVEGGGFTTFLAPGVAFADQGGAVALLTTPALEACAAACQGSPDCEAFEYCDAEDGCPLGQPKLLYKDCRLMGSNCTLLLAVEAAGPWMSRVTGFPLRRRPVELPDFTTAPAQVVEGGNFDCTGSVLPGRCAFPNVLDAISICSGMAGCRSVLHYHNGTDGCSGPVAVLSTSWPTDSNSFVAPTVDVLTKKGDRTATSLLMASDGTVVLPSDAELAAAANASDPSTAWLGCILADGALMDGEMVATKGGLATAEDCCRACRADRGCNVWNYCAQADGCSFAASSPVLGSVNVSLVQGQCELRYQSTVAAGWPPVVLAKGSDVPLTAGAPLAVASPQLPGYVALPGRAMLEYGTFPCPDSVWPERDQCIAIDQPAQLAEKCTANPDCVAMMVAPLPGPPSAQRIGNFRNAFNASMLGLSPGDMVYVRDSALEAGSSSSSLSGGAIAGIVVGCCAAAAVLAGAIWLALQWRQWKRRAQASNGAVGGLKGPTANGSSHGGNANGSQYTSSAYGSGSTDPVSSTCVPTANSGSAAAPDSPATDAHGLQQRLQAAPDALLPSGMRCMRAGWKPSRIASPFASQAAKPFGPGATPYSPWTAQPATSAQLTAPPVTSDGPSPIVAGAASRRFNSAQNVSVLPINAADAMAAAASGMTAVGSGNGLGSPSQDSYGHSSEEQPLPELARYVAECDAARSTGLRTAPSLTQDITSITIDSLPPTLRGSVVDVSKVRYLTGPSGDLQELGRGASATVYRALYLNDIVAAKEIDIGRSQAMQEAFVNEALRLHQLHHPHVVALLGVTLAGSTGILLMEYCAGRDLRSALGLMAADSNERLFGWFRRGRRVILEIAKALNFLHARGVVHMDVKSNNVLLTSGGTAKLADVGLARLQTGTYLSDVPLIGTFAWIAPEVLVGSNQCTSAVDIYSLGVVMWEVITGERPQRGSLRALCVPDECPQEVADLMMECLRLEPSQRPTASQLVRRLEGGRGRLEGGSVRVPLRSASSATTASELRH